MKKEDKRKVLAELDELARGTSGVVRGTIEDCKRVIGEMSEDDGWIPVTERLPEEHDRFICTYKFNSNSEMQFVGVLEYYASCHCPHWQHESAGVIVTHWMPLAEPPKEESEC